MSMHDQTGFERAPKPDITKSRYNFPSNSETKWDYNDRHWSLNHNTVKGSAEYAGWWPGTIYVPYWVKLALVRNNLDTSDLINLEKLETVLSVSDLAKFIRTQYTIDELLYKEGYQCSDSCAAYNLYSLNRQKKNERNTRFEEIMPLANTDEIKAETVSLLSIEDKNIELDLSKNYHRMELYKDNMILIYVDPGILNALKDRDYTKRFISDYLKAQYTFLPIHEIGNNMWSRELFYHYMKLL